MKRSNSNLYKASVLDKAAVGGRDHESIDRASMPATVSLEEIAPKDDMVAPAVSVKVLTWSLSAKARNTKNYDWSSEKDEHARCAELAALLRQAGSVVSKVEKEKSKKRRFMRRNSVLIRDIHVIGNMFGKEQSTSSNTQSTSMSGSPVSVEYKTPSGASIVEPKTDKND